jgi:bidirectional [NiFe] hydrogenase diaphorase subunit
LTDIRPERGTDERWRIVQAEIRRSAHAPDALIEVLHVVQDQLGYLDEAALREVSAALELPLSKVFGVATFYSYFSLVPPGQHRCVVCTGTACHIEGAAAILRAVEDSLGIGSGETTADGTASLAAARCIGTCSLAPLVVLDGEVVGRTTVAEVTARVEAW